MARTKNFETKNLKAAAYYVLAESNEKANVTNIAKQVNINRTQLQNHYKFEELRVLAVEHALEKLTSNIFKIFKSETGTFEVKIKMLVLHYMTQAKKHPNLVSFIGKEFDLLEIETIRSLKQKALKNLEPFEKELETYIEQGEFIDTDALQVLMYIMSLASYPIIAGRAIEIATGTHPNRYKRVLKRQKEEVIEFILKGFKKDLSSTEN
jgi:AcrR family transcriptional regulator